MDAYFVVFAAGFFAVDFFAVGFFIVVFAAGFLVGLAFASAFVATFSGLRPAAFAIFAMLALRREAVFFLIRPFFAALSYSD